MAATTSSASRRVALITGGTRGIGLGIAKEMVRDGYTDLVLGYNSDSEAAAKAKSLLEQMPGVHVECVGGDLSKKESMRALFQCVKDKFDNQLEAFVHNAGLYIGITSTSDSQPKTRDDFEDTWPYYYQVYVLAFKRGLEHALKCQGLKHVVAVSGQGCNCNSVRDQVI
jgi:NAD(P)-dependent dehydrogenase (short-subunit alcohol dehydrogenase family)